MSLSELACFFSGHEWGHLRCKWQENGHFWVCMRCGKKKDQ